MLLSLTCRNSRLLINSGAYFIGSGQLLNNHNPVGRYGFITIETMFLVVPKMGALPFLLLLSSLMPDQAISVEGSGCFIKGILFRNNE